MRIITFLKKSKLWILLFCSICMIGFVLLIYKPIAFKSASLDKQVSVEQLKSLPYAAWIPIKDKDRNKLGVTEYNQDLAWKGVNLYCSENKPGAYILDMTGNILHTFHDKTKKAHPWKLIKPCLDDHFLVMKRNELLIFKIDWDSNVKWKKRMRAHHDFALAPSGEIYVLTRKKALFPELDRERPLRDDRLLILGRNLRKKKVVSFAKIVLKNKVLVQIVRRKVRRKYAPRDKVLDIFHTNTIEIIDRDISKRRFFLFRRKVFKKGDVLFCMRHLNIIGVLNVHSEEIIWIWGQNELEKPHHPSLLDNGNILIFDNGTKRKFSRVIELNPLSEKIEWEYKANPPESFYSNSRGAAQRLPNGNTLITESDSGHVFEITPDGEVVWEFYNPEVSEDGMRRAAIYRMMRFFDAKKYSFLRLLKNRTFHD